MVEQKMKPAAKAGGPAGSRQSRSAEALRANLRRRKAQARARAEADTPAEPLETKSET